MYILIVITYLGGAAWGPVVTMQEFSSEKNCIAAKELTMTMTTNLNQTNLAGGSSRRDIIDVKCVAK